MHYEQELQFQFIAGFWGNGYLNAFQNMIGVNEKKSVWKKNDKFTFLWSMDWISPFIIILHFILTSFIEENYLTILLRSLSKCYSTLSKWPLNKATGHKRHSLIYAVPSWMWLSFRNELTTLDFEIRKKKKLFFGENFDADRIIRHRPLLFGNDFLSPFAFPTDQIGK